MPPPTQRWIRPSAIANVRIVSARSRSPFAADDAERAHRRAAADRLERGDQIERGDLRRAGDRAAGEGRREELGEPDVGPQRPLDGRDEVGDAGELALGHQLRPVHRAGLADAREVVALEVDDHHVLGGVLLALDVLAERARALDRRRPDPAAAAREEELGRGGDDRPAVAGQQPRSERAEPAPRATPRLARERRREVLDEVDLVDVAAPDRRAHRLDRFGVVRVGPRPLPLARPRRVPGTDPGTCPARSRPRAAAGTARAAPETPSGGAAPRGRSRGRDPLRGARRRARRTHARAGTPRSARTRRRASAARARLAQRAGGRAQELDAEAEVVDVRPLVGGVDQPRRQLGLHRLQREEAVRDRAERLAEPVRVGEAGAAERRELRARLGRLDPAGDRVPERRVERRPRPAEALDRLQLVVRRPRRGPSGRSGRRPRASGRGGAFGRRSARPSPGSRSGAPRRRSSSARA